MRLAFTQLPGLLIERGFLSPAMEATLVAAIEADVPPEVLRGAQLHGRSRIERYGPGVAASGYTTAHHTDAVIPPAIRELADRVGREVDEAFAPDAITVAWYMPGDLVSAHVDRDTCGETIAVVSLLSDVVMRFSTLERKPVLDVAIPRGSLTVLRGKARWNFLHEIPAVTSPRIAIVMRQAQR